MNFVEKLAAANDLAALEAEVAKRENYKIRRYFPETGPLSRHKYVRAMEFFAAGNHYPERLILGGNRCLTPWTAIQTDRGERQIAELCASPQFDVRAWDGSSPCSKQAGGVFLKGIEPMFRVQMDTGAWFDASWNHRLWADGSWHSLGQIAHAVGGMHYQQIPPSCSASCERDCRRCGGRLRDTAGADPAQLPSRGDALAPTRLGEHTQDAAEPRYGYIRPYLGGVPPSNIDDPDQIAALCASFADPTDALAAVWCSQTRRALARLACAWLPHPEAAGVSSPAPSFDCQAEWVDPVLEQQRQGGRRGCLNPEQWLRQESRDAAWRRFHQAAPHTALFCPSHLQLGTERVESIIPIGYGPVMDFTVEDVHNYYAAGVVHHNTGKTESAAFETSVHLTGEYPDWWPGRRFTHPILAWAAGDTATTTRDIQQLSLYGPIPAAPKSGLIPAHHIRHVATKNSVAGGLETIFVRHKSGGDSQIQFRSFDQRREAFQGTERHLIWLDEEPPEDVYTEALMRTLTCQGIMMVTFTPVEGLTPFVQNWIEQAVIIHVNTNERTGEQTEVVEAADAVIFQGLDDAPDAELVEVDAKGKVIAAEPRPALTVDQSMLKQVVPIAARTKRIIMVSWTDVPHLSPEACAQMLSSIPPYQRNARLKGIPNLGSGVIYPIPEEEIRVDPFDIPAHWPRGYGMDVGWNWTAATHCAYDTSSDIWYLYRAYKRSGAEPPVHAAGIKAAGEWIPGVIDPAANSRGQKDGVRLMSMYRQLGLHLEFAQNDVATGLDMIWMLLSSGRLKVFSHLKDFFTEYRMYRRNIKGEVVKKDDHLCDSLRYRILSGTGSLQVAPVASGGRVVRDYGGGSGNYGWMG